MPAATWLCSTLIAGEGQLDSLFAGARNRSSRARWILAHPAPAPVEVAHGALLLPRYSAQACRKICTDEVRKMAAITPATARSGQALAVPQTVSAAIMTMTLPIASFREQSQTERTLASPSL